MILPKPQDALHKAWLYRILSAFADHSLLVNTLRFKGGTCAAMRGLIERFSIDLDFDLIAPERMTMVQKEMETIFKKRGLEIKDRSQKAPQYFLKYSNKTGERNTLQIDVSFPPPKSNDYEPVRFGEIDRIFFCHTIPTMFANKLVTVLDRFKKFHSIAGRDLFDIHAFFLQGFPYKKEVIFERTGKKPSDFMKNLKEFIEKRITQTILDQDLNTLLPAHQFHQIRGVLKKEVLMFLTQTL